MKLKMLFTALAALMITGTTLAQEKNENTLRRSKERIENLAQYIQMDEATTEKVVDAMYRYMIAHNEVTKNTELSAEEKKAGTSEAYANWRKETASLLNAEQRAGYNKWLKLPVEERYKKISQ